MLKTINYEKFQMSKTNPKNSLFEIVLSDLNISHYAVIEVLSLKLEYNTLFRILVQATFNKNNKHITAIQIGTTV